MAERIIENNKVKVRGKILENFKFDHEVFGEKFYISHIVAERTSGTEDIIPVMVSERTVDVRDWINRFVEVKGRFCSYNKHEENKSRLILSIFAKEIYELSEDDLEGLWDENSIFLDGYICKAPTYRQTPLGREIADAVVASNRPYGKSDYIPCIFWGRNARFVSSLEIGTRIRIEGRIQSREYMKQINEEEFERRTAYEVSTNKIRVVNETEGSKHEEEN